MLTQALSLKQKATTPARSHAQPILVQTPECWQIDQRASLMTPKRQVPPAAPPWRWPRGPGSLLFLSHEPWFLSQLFQRTPGNDLLAAHQVLNPSRCPTQNLRLNRYWVAEDRQGRAVHRS